MKKLLLFAHPCEAEDTLLQLQAQRIESGRYAYQGGWIIISGMGMLAAQAAVYRWAPWVDEVWNLGFCGSLKAFPLGTVFAIKSVAKCLLLPKAIDARSAFYAHSIAPEIRLYEEGKCLISTDFPLHQNIHLKADLVDMEGYGVAYACYELKKKCRLWKVTSDFSSKGGRAIIGKKKKIFSKMLANKVKEYESCCIA